MTGGQLPMRNGAIDHLPNQPGQLTNFSPSSHSFLTFTTMKRFLCLLLFSGLLFAGRMSAQVFVHDTLLKGFSLSANYGYHFPGGDLAKRFGNNSSIGVSGHYKTKSNFVFSMNWTYLFGNKFNEDSLLHGITTSDGFVIDREGKYADIRLFERGFTLNASVGKILPVFNPNPNSGLFLNGGIGILQHKIRVYDNGGRAPQVSGDYIKGYDRLTNGLALTEFVGYWYMSSNRFVNFYAGFEFTQALTKSRRSWDYSKMRADTEQRFDALYGGRIGWIILINRKGADKRYY
jgi:hypothetical protein